VQDASEQAPGVKNDSSVVGIDGHIFVKYQTRSVARELGFFLGVRPLRKTSLPSDRIPENAVPKLITMIWLAHPGQSEASSAMTKSRARAAC